MTRFVPSRPMSSIRHLLDRNRAWASRISAEQPGFFRSLGFHVDALGVEPDGRNINLNCGSTHLAPLQQRVNQVETVLRQMPPAAVAWLLAGGIFFTLGAVIYIAKWPDLFPKVFGFHEVWHIFVILGGLSHFIMIAAYIAPSLPG